MPRLTTVIVEKAVRDAFTAWASEQQPEGIWQRLCRVDPNAGYPQGSVSHTAFATALFAEVAAAVREPDDRIIRVTYRGVPKADQEPLDTLITSRLTGVTLEHREYGTLDFSLLVHRAQTSVPHAIRLGVESEMKPVSGKGADPDQLVPDLVKLATIDAQFKLFVGRVNGGRETVAGEKKPKWQRLKPVFESTLCFAGNRAEESVVCLLETQQAGPWSCHLIHCGADRVPTYASFDVAD